MECPPFLVLSNHLQPSESMFLLLLSGSLENPSVLGLTRRRLKGSFVTLVICLGHLGGNATSRLFQVTGLAIGINPPQFDCIGMRSDASIECMAAYGGGPLKTLRPEGGLSECYGPDIVPLYFRYGLQSCTKINAHERFYTFTYKFIASAGLRLLVSRWFVTLARTLPP